MRGEIYARAQAQGDQGEGGKWSATSYAALRAPRVVRLLGSKCGKFTAVCDAVRQARERNVGDETEGSSFRELNPELRRAVYPSGRAPWGPLVLTWKTYDFTLCIGRGKAVAYAPLTIMAFPVPTPHIHGIHNLTTHLHFRLESDGCAPRDTILYVRRKT